MGLSVGSGVKQAPGAGRTEHLIYPPTERNRNTGAGPGNDVTARPGIYLTGRATVATGGGTPGSCGARGLYKGAYPWTYRNTIAGDSIKTNAGGDFYPLLEALSNDINPYDPSHVFRFLAITAFPALGGALGATAEVGLELLPGNVASMNSGATRPGVSFGPIDAAGTIALRVRKAFAGAYTLDRQLTPAQMGVVDITNWNIWELRLVSADSHGAGQLKAFINGRQFGASVDCSAAAGIMFALDAAGGGFIGFHWHLINSNTGAYDFHCNEQHFIRAATEDDAS